MPLRTLANTRSNGLQSSKNFNINLLGFKVKYDSGWYVELTHSWDNTLFKKHFESGKSTILQVNNQDKGALKVEYLDEFIYLADLVINPTKELERVF